MKIYADLHSNMQKPEIKNSGGNEVINENYKDLMVNATLVSKDLAGSAPSLNSLLGLRSDTDLTKIKLGVDKGIPKCPLLQ